MGELLLMLSIIDHESMGQDGKQMVYTRAFVRIFHLLSPKGVPDKIHGMLEVQEPPLSHARKRLSLGSQ